MTHDYLEAFDDHVPKTGIEYHYYDQLGCGNSDHPDDLSLWEIDRSVDEVEQVRLALGLRRENFVLYGQSYGGVLAIEYALRFPCALRGLVLSNMTSSATQYNDRVRNELLPQIDPAARAEIEALDASGDYDNPRFEALLGEHFYSRFLLRLPPEDFPGGLAHSLEHTNQAIYHHVQGRSELAVHPDAVLAGWDRTEALADITVPTLVIGATYDTMDPEFLRSMAERLPNGAYWHCPNGSHLSSYDDQETYFAGLKAFLSQLPA